MFSAAEKWSRMDQKQSSQEDGNKNLMDLESMVQKSLPNWTALWHMVVNSMNENKPEEKSLKSIEKSDKNLQKKIQRKVHELVNEQETLLNLYKEAAEVARAKEEEFKDKSLVLLEQIEKDKHLLRNLKDLF